MAGPGLSGASMLPRKLPSKLSNCTTDCLRNSAMPLLNGRSRVLAKFDGLCGTSVPFAMDGRAGSFVGFVASVSASLSLFCRIRSRHRTRSPNARMVLKPCPVNGSATVRKGCTPSCPFRSCHSLKLQVATPSRHRPSRATRQCERRRC